jgi:ubiquinone/menaquinone biosynthesis C-methylase UbiE
MGITPQGLGNSTATSDFAMINRLSMVAEVVDLNGKTILDIGCNDAAYTVTLARSARTVIGIDIEGERLKNAIHRLRTCSAPVSVFFMSAEKIGFDDHSFDYVFINEVLEHIPDQDSALDEIHRVLKKNGRFILFAPNRFYPFETHGARIGQCKFGRFIPIVHWLPRFIGRHFMNARSYTPQELNQLLARHRLTVIHQSCLFPPFDGLRMRLARYKLAGLIDGYRKIISLIKKIPILQLMGLSIFVVAARTKDIQL